MILSLSVLFIPNINTKMKNLVFLIFLYLSMGSSKAQISFPDSNVLNLHTTNDVLYYETRILFNTGKYKSDDYKWEKISDSLDSRWFFTSCFNGDCRLELLQSGSFIKDFGINDTTCFIAFHVLTNGYDGRSVIKYRVYNKTDTSDKADLIYNINYKYVAAVETKANDELKVSNTENSQLVIFNSSKLIDKVFLYDMDGKNVHTWIRPIAQNFTTHLDLPVLCTGIYYLGILQGNTTVNRKILINK